MDGLGALLLVCGVAAIAAGSTAARRAIRRAYGELTEETREQAEEEGGVVPLWAIALVLAGWVALMVTFGRVAFALLRNLF